MRRISTPTAAQDLFGPGKHGFRNGDPANAILATRLQAEWFNALQEEVCNAVEGAGEALDEDQNNQLSEVIEGVVDRKAPVPSQEEALAGTENTKRMTPLRVRQAMEAFGGVLPLGYFSGFVLANSVAAPNTTITVSVGAARSADNSHSIFQAVALSGILQSAGAWAAGDNQNKLDAGARAANTWYHVYAIRKTSDGTGDILFSLSATAPTLPAGYAGFRRIGSVKTDGSSNIIGFTNVGRMFIWKSPPLDVNVSGSIVDAAYVLSVPPGVRALAKLGVGLIAGEAFLSYRATDSNAIVPSYTTYVGGIGMASSSVDYTAHEVSVLTNTAAQAHFRTEFAASPFRVVTYGWTEF